MRRIEAAETIQRWTEFEPKISKVLAKSSAGQYAVDVLTALQLGSMQLWDFNEGQAFCVSEIQTYPRYSQLLIFLVGGEYAPDWFEIGCQQLEAFAREKNCAYLAFIGRPGWQRYAEVCGFHGKQISMRKEIS